MVDSNRLKFIEKENKWFIRYELLEQEKVVKIELEMMKNNHIPGVLRISEIQDDKSCIFLYDVTGKIQLVQRFQASFSGEQLYQMLKSLCSIWKLSGEYMLNIDHMVFYPELMCVDIKTSELYVMIMPIEDQKNPEMDFRRILIGIFEQLWYEDEQMPGFYNAVFSYINHCVQMNIIDFAEFLEKIYKSHRGILKPVSEVPEQPKDIEIRGKEIVHEEEAKEMLKARFEAQNYEEVRHLGDVTLQMGLQQTPVTQQTTGKPKATIMVPGENVPPMIPEQGKKKKDKKTQKIKSEKVKPEKPQKVKPVKSEKKKPEKAKSANLEKQGEDESITPAGNAVFGEQKEGKEKKGLFSGLFGKKKEQKPPVDEKEPVQLKPVSELNQERIVGNVMPSPNNFMGTGWGADYPQNGQIPDGDIGFSPNGQMKAGNAGLSQNGQTPIENARFSGNEQIFGNSAGFLGNSQGIYQGMGQPSVQPRANNYNGNPYPAWTFYSSDSSGGQRKNFQTVSVQEKQERNFQAAPVQKAPIGEQAETGNVQPLGAAIDLDKTVLSEQILDLDATMLDEGIQTPVVLPMLRSRETGEVVKITKNGFLVGRQRMRNGRPYIVQTERQPDLILQMNNISRPHAEFVWKDEKWYLADQGSLNGTYLNGKKLEKNKEHLLKEGDIVGFASVEYEFLMVGQ